MRLSTLTQINRKMEYVITIPRNSGDTRGESFIVNDFSSLRKFIYSLYMMMDDNGDSMKGYKTLENLLDSQFCKSNLEDDNYHLHQCSYSSTYDDVATWDEFMEHGEYTYSPRERIFVHDDHLINVDDGDIQVSESFAIDNFYVHSDGEYYSTQELVEEEDYMGYYLRSYHSGNSEYHITIDADDPFADSDYLIGIEFEKEDFDVLRSIEISDFEIECYNWRKESDGSLDDESGFELISPIYPLFPHFIIDDIKKNHILLSHVNANISSSCGGHMNLSQNGVSPSLLFDKMKWYLPLLYAMYPNRRNITYCEKKKILGNEESFERKYSPIAIKSNRIEFRIFSGIKNINQLHFRLKLIEMFTQNTINDFHSLIDVVSQNESLFMMVYSPLSFQKMISRMVDEINDEIRIVA